LEHCPYLGVLGELELELDSLLQASEAPFPLVPLEGGNGEELGYGILGVGLFDLLRIVVLILDVDVAGILILLVLVLEVVAARCAPSVSGRVHWREPGGDCFTPRRTLA
jgi:hypothetical protein